jgi:hypothetical protein
MAHDGKLCEGVALIGQWKPKPQGGRVIASKIRIKSILGWVCRHGRSKAKHQNDGGKGVLELHGL